MIQVPTGDGFEQNEFGGRVFAMPSCYSLTEHHLNRFRPVRYPPVLRELGLRCAYGHSHGSFEMNLRSAKVAPTPCAPIGTRGALVVVFGQECEYDLA